MILVIDDVWYRLNHVRIHKYKIVKLNKTKTVLEKLMGDYYCVLGWTHQRYSTKIVFQYSEWQTAKTIRFFLDKENEDFELTVNFEKYSPITIMGQLQLNKNLKNIRKYLFASGNNLT